MNNKRERRNDNDREWTNEEERAWEINNEKEKNAADWNKNTLTNKNEEERRKEKQRKRSNQREETNDIEINKYERDRRLWKQTNQEVSLRNKWMINNKRKEQIRKYEREKKEREIYCSCNNFCISLYFVTLFLQSLYYLDIILNKVSLKYCSSI